MRAYIPDYQLTTPTTLAETLALLASEPGLWKPFAGGTDLMVLLETGKLSHRNYVNIWHLDELRGIDSTLQHVTVGALTTYTDVQANTILRDEFPMLCQAASETGGLAIQNRGTLGGNIVNASPAADSPPAFLAYDAEIELTSAQGSRWLPYQGFHMGYKQMNMRADELLTRIRLTRSKQALKLAATARASGHKIDEIRIALGSVAPIPLRCVRTEGVLRGQVVDQSLIETGKSELAREIVPIDDIRSTKDYRLRISENLLGDFLSSIAATS